MSFFYATSVGNLTVAEALLDHGARTVVLICIGSSCLDISERSRHHDFCRNTAPPGLDSIGTRDEYEDPGHSLCPDQKSRRFGDKLTSNMSACQNRNESSGRGAGTNREPNTTSTVAEQVGSNGSCIFRARSIVNLMSTSCHLLVQEIWHHVFLTAPRLNDFQGSVASPTTTGMLALQRRFNGEQGDRGESDLN